MTDIITREAIAWHGAQRSDDADWAGFARWLAADPRHRETYDEVALIEDLIDRNREALAMVARQTASGDASSPAPDRRWRRWTTAGSGAAIALLALVTLHGPLEPPPARTFATNAHESRQIALAHGVKVELAAASSLKVAGGESGEMTLVGSAFFDVAHRPDRTLVIHAGGAELRDIGTRFEVTTGGGEVQIAVAEGRLSLAVPQLTPSVTLAAGKRALVDPKAGNVELSDFHPQGLASWRQGKLVYENAPLSLVVSDIGRYSGKIVSVDSGLANRRFSGILTIGDGSALLDDLARIMGLTAHGDGRHVRLSPHGGS